MKDTNRYIVTEVVSICVTKMGKKSEAYNYATKPGYGVVEWYSAANDYIHPCNRDKSDKTQVMYCGDDSSAEIYDKNGRAFLIYPYDEINIKDAPKQEETRAIIIDGACGFMFWVKDDSDIRIFVRYDSKGLIDSYRLSVWGDTASDGEVEISFNDLQSEHDHDNIDRCNIVGTFEYNRKAL